MKINFFEIFLDTVRQNKEMHYSSPKWKEVELEDVDVLDDLGHTLIVHNDDHNTFEWVIKCLIEVCKHTPEQAEQCSLFIHFKGRYGVKRGGMDELKPMKQALIDRGLSVTIEENE